MEPTIAAVPDRSARSLVNGPLYLLVDWSVTRMARLSLVEGVKWAAVKLLKPLDGNATRSVRNAAIDMFIVAKWIFILAIWYFDISNSVAAYAAVYLLAMNIHTYFWYHLWTARAPGSADEADRERHRFVNLVLALAFSIVAYAYLYHRVVGSGFDWSRVGSIEPWAAALRFSVGNALTSSTGDLNPNSTTTYLLAASQLVMTFVFATMLLANSIPRPRPDGGGAQ